jgi:lysophospholipase L1-like esterase
MMKRRLLISSLVAIWIVGTALTVALQPVTADLGFPGFLEFVSLTIAQDESGDLWAAWEARSTDDVEIYFSHWSGGDWSTPQPVQSRPQAWDRSPSLALAANGEVWLAWSSTDKNSLEQSRIYTSRWADSRWTNPEPVPLGDALEGKEPALAAGVQDNALWLAWVGFDGTDDEIFASRWDGQAWLPPQQVSTDDAKPSLYDRQPQLAVGQDGRPWLVWTSHQDGVDDEISYSHWTGEGWTPEQMISEDDDALDVSPSLLLDAHGQPWVAWENVVGKAEQMRSRVLVSRWDAGRSGWTDEAVASSPLAADVNETSPALALRPDGQIHLAWVASGVAGSKLVHAQEIDGQWTEPRLVTSAVADTPPALAFAADGSAILLQLVPSAAGQVPVEGRTVEDGAQPLAAWIEEQPSFVQPLVAPIANRHLAFGDSITWGQYDPLLPTPGTLTPYPVTLENKLDTRVVESEVINSGVPGNSTYHGLERIKTEVPTYRPQFVLYMLGTNDVTRDVPPSKVRNNIEFTIAIAKHSGVDNLKFMVATIIPRSDGRYRDTAEMNEMAIIPAAQNKNVPVCDQWQAFHDYGPWQSILLDGVHPDQTGLNILANTFYGCILDNYTWLVEDTEPPDTWITQPLPSSQSECRQVPVAWTGTDNRSWVVDYDVQVDTGTWTDWLLATQNTSATYTGGTHGDWVGFRVRGRDVLGNQSAYTDRPAVYTQIVDTTPPVVQIAPLPPYEVAPIPVYWSGSDTCTGVNTYDVQYRVGPSGTWQNWLTGTSNTSGSFVPPSPQYGQTYYFHVRARDGASNLSAWSPGASTILARFAVGGNVYTVRHKPVIGADVSLTPAPAHIERYVGGGFTAYLMSGGNYAVSASRSDRFGALPPMSLVVSDHVEGLQFILPPQDDAVTNGGFESGGDPLLGWVVSGTGAPALPTEAHTGDGAVLLGESGTVSRLVQTVTIPDGLIDPTLSFLVKLHDDDDVSSTLTVELDGTPISHTQAVQAGDWSHVWFPVDAASGTTVTLSFTVSDKPPVRLDEVSLGSAVPGGGVVYMPIVGRASMP